MNEFRALLWFLFNWPSSRKMSRPRKLSLLDTLAKFDEGILCFDKLEADFSKVYNVLSLNIVLAPNFTQRKLRRVFFSSFLLFSASSCSCLLCSVHLINVWFSFTFKDALYFDRDKTTFFVLKYVLWKIRFSFYLVNNFATEAIFVQRQILFVICYTIVSRVFCLQQKHPCNLSFLLHWHDFWINIFTSKSQILLQSEFNKSRFLGLNTI